VSLLTVAGGRQAANNEIFSRTVSKLEVENNRPVTMLCARLMLLPTGFDTKCYFNVQSKAAMSQLNLPHGTNN